MVVEVSDTALMCDDSCFEGYASRVLLLGQSDLFLWNYTGRFYRG